MKRLKTIDRVVLLGVGTSYYAAKLGELYFNTLTKLPATAAMSPEFRYTKNNLDEKTWVIGVSQSGETADTLAALEEAKQHGALVTGLVNVVGSAVSRTTEAGVYNHIGPEISVASTKAFTSQSLLLLMHAILIGRKRWT
jgi:glutamine---fructose-6-phosphate transaminase (isomerizing)